MVKIMEVHAAMQRRDARSCLPAQEWKVKVIAVKVNDVKLRRLAKNQFHKPDVVRQRLTAIRITPKGAMASRTSLALVSESPLGIA